MALSTKTEALLLASTALTLDVLSEIPNEEKDEALALLKSKIDAYNPAEPASVKQLVEDVKNLVESAEDLAGKPNLIPGTDKAFSVLEAIAEGASPLWALFAGLFHKHTA